MRIEALLLTNYTESCLKDIIEYELQTKYARNISRQIIAEILRDKNKLNKELFEDVKKVFQIRDLFSHNLSLNEIETNVRSIISQMHATPILLKTLNLTWNTLQTPDKLTKISLKIINELNEEFGRSVIERSKTS